VVENLFSSQRGTLFTFTDMESEVDCVVSGERVSARRCCFLPCPNFEEEELFQEIRQKSFSPKLMPWEPSKIKDFNKVLERNEYH
jgi:hypothetical protein